MTFDITGFRTLEHGGALGSGDGSVKGIHHYVTNDTLATVAASGYFNSVTNLLTKGDVIFVSGDIDGTPAINAYVVNSATGAATVTTVGFSTVTQTYVNEYVMTDELSLTDGTYQLFPFPKAGTITKIYTVLRAGAVTTNDAVCTFRINTTNITNGVVTVTASGSAAGDIDSASPSAANVVAAGQYLSCVVSGTPGGSRVAGVSVLVAA
ncbi:MAG: hypothetical protein AB7G80_09525 [Dongiaceae bacterium]